MDVKDLPRLNGVMMQVRDEGESWVEALIFGVNCSEGSLQGQYIGIISCWDECKALDE